MDDTRADELAQWSEVVFVPGVWPKDSDPLRYLVVRLQRRQGALFASGEQYKYLAVVSNRQGPGDELLRWHWKKAGTIEHVHDETKNGLGAGVLPCWEFGANAAKVPAVDDGLQHHDDGQAADAAASAADGHRPSACGFWSSTWQPASPPTPATCTPT